MSRLGIVLQLCFVILLCCFFFARNWANLYQPYDGLYMQILSLQYFKWNNFTSSLVINPMQGLGGVVFPINFWFSPSSLLTYLVAGDAPNKVIPYTINTVFFFISTFFLASSLRASHWVALWASWLGTVLVMCFQNQWAFTTISRVSPLTIEQISLSSFTIGLSLLFYGNKSRRSWIFLVLALILYTISVVASPMGRVLDLPLLGIFCIFCLTGQAFRQARLTNKVLVLLTIFIFVAVPFMHVFFVLLPTATIFFNSELFPLGKGGLSNISVFFNAAQGGAGLLGTVVYCTGICGGVIAWRDESGTMKRVARIYVLYSISLSLVGCVLASGLVRYNGPTTSYFEFFVWPFMFIYTSYLILRLFKFAFLLVSEQCFHSLKQFVASRAQKYSQFAFILPFFFVFMLLLFSRPDKMFFLSVPPRETRMIKVLRDGCQTLPGLPWRGRVASFSGFSLLHDDEKYDWETFFSYGIKLWSATGNDHQTLGLWWYGISTLFEYSPTTSPEYYYLMTRLFSTPRILQQRNVVMVMKPNTRMLRLMGVKYVLMDSQQDLGPDSHLIDQLKREDYLPDVPSDVSKKYPLYLYELERPNVGSYSPTNLIVEATAQGALNKFFELGFDPERSIVLSQSIDGHFSKATLSSFVWDKGGISIQATASGKSMLLLPLQYSNCLKVEDCLAANDGPLPILVRANIGVTAVIFTDYLNARITYGGGMFENVDCRFRDYKELRLMGLEGGMPFPQRNDAQIE